MPAPFSVGVVGLGNLGFPIAMRLQAHGVKAQVAEPDSVTLHHYIRDNQAASSPAATATHLARMSNLILLVMPTDQSLPEVVSGPAGIVHGLQPGAIVVDMTSTDPEAGKKLSRAVIPKGGRWIEAQPIGTPQAARKGELTLLCGGSRDIVDQARPVLSVLAGRVIHLGQLGSGAIARTLAGTMTALAMAATAEALIVAQKAGLDAGGLLDALAVIAPHAGTPPPAIGAEVLSRRFQPTYTLERMTADLDRSLEAARRLGIPAPLMAMVREFAVASRLGPDARGDFTDLVRWQEAIAQTELRSEPPPAPAATVSTAPAA